MALVNLMLDWDLTSFLTNVAEQMKTWGGLLFIAIGVIMIIVGIVKLFMGLVSRQAHTNWVVVFVLIFLGGALTVGGWSWVAGIAEGGKKTIDELGGGVILLRSLPGISRIF